MENTFTRGIGRTIYGGLRDGVDLTSPNDVRAVLAKLTAAKVKLPPILVEELARLEAEHTRKTQLVAAYRVMLEELDALFAAEDAAAEKALSDRTITFPNEPASESDVLVIGMPIEAAVQHWWEDREIDGKIYRFHPHRMLHWVPEALAAAWPARLPGRVFLSPPSDLLRAYRNEFSRVKAGGRQGTGPGFSEVEVDEDGLMAAVAHIVRACAYRPLLDAWLAVARAAGDEPNQVLVKVIAEQLARLGDDEAA